MQINDRSVIVAGFAVALAIVAIFAAMFVGGFSSKRSEVEGLKARIRALEQRQHVHDADGRPVYPPTWRPR